jgi:hypothetical protein
MRLYDDKLLALLRPELGKEPIYHVGLGAHDFQFAFGNLLRVQNMLRVDFYLQGVEYTWESGPCGIPAWLLIDQVPSELTLESATALRVNFASGDWLRLHTEEGPYESQIFEWPNSKEEAIAMEIF